MESYLQDLENSKKTHQMISSSRRNKQTGESILNKAIEVIIKDLYAFDANNIFRYPVDKKLAPGYYDIVKHPVCMEEMSQRAKRQEYLTIDSFQGDIVQMRCNAELFNGPHNEIAQLARNIEAKCFELSNSNEMQEQIQIANSKIGIDF